MCLYFQGAVRLRAPIRVVLRFYYLFKGGVGA